MDKNQPKSLRRQLLIQLSVPLLLVLALGAVVSFTVARHIGYMVHDQWLLDSAMTLAQQVKYKDGSATLDLPKSAVEMFRWDSLDLIYEEVVTESQTILSSNAHFPRPPKALAAGKPYYYDGTIEGHPVRIVALALERQSSAHEVVTIQVAETIYKRKAMANQVIRLSAPLQVVIQILAGILIWSAVTRNLRQVDDIAARLVGYQLEKLLPIRDAESAPLEIKPLVTAINGLIQKLSESQETQRRFIANAAHQMRTPLANLQVQSQRALREQDPVKHSEALHDVFNAVTRQHRVVQQLLTMARSEPGAQDILKLHPLDLAELAREEVERWTDQALAKSIDLGYDGPDAPVVVEGDPFLLRELVSNLLDNAIRYHGGGGTITLSLRTQPVRLMVEDDGPGIAEKDREHLFERFYRPAGSHSAGCGLGLAIAQEITARHRASLEITPGSGGKGTRATITFS